MGRDGGVGGAVGQGDAGEGFVEEDDGQTLRDAGDEVGVGVEEAEHPDDADVHGAEFGDDPFGGGIGFEEEHGADLASVGRGDLAHDAKLGLGERARFKRGDVKDQERNVAREGAGGDEGADAGTSVEMSGADESFDGLSAGHVGDAQLA